MFCEKCGKSFDGDGTLCGECAAEVTAAVVNEAPAAEQSSALPPIFESGNTQAAPVANEQQAAVGQQTVDQQAVNQQVVNQQAVDQQAGNTPDGAAAPDAADGGEEAFTLGAPAKPEKKKRKLNGKLIAIIAAIVALVGGGCFFFFFTDAGKYMTSSPEEYLQDVQQDEISTYIDGATTLYGTFLDAPTTSANAADVRFQAGDALFELANAAGVPADQLNFLRDVRISADSNIVQNAIQTRFRFGLGETEIAQADVIMDMITSRLYMALPGLNSEYLSAVLPANSINLAQQEAALKKLREDLPSESAMNKMLNSFVEAALNELVNVQKAEEIVMVNGVSEEHHVLTATITQGDAIRMVKAILEKAQADETFKELLTAVSNYANMMGANVDIYNEITTQMSVGIAELAGAINTTSGETVVLKTYINHSGEITGRIVTVFAGGPAQEVMRYLSATEDGVTQTQGNIRDFYFSGQKQTTGKVTTGKYTFFLESEEMLTLDVIATEDESTEFRVTPGKGIFNRLMGGSVASNAVSDGSDSSAAVQSSSNSIAGLLAGSISVSMTVSDPDADAPAVTFSAQLNGNSVFTLSIGAKESESQDIVIPPSFADATDQNAAQEWLKKIDFASLMNKLRAAGVSDALVTQLESMLESELGISIAQPAA